jgi:hypothetical protein
MLQQLKDNLQLLLEEIKEFTNFIDQDIGVSIGEHSCAYTDTNDIVVGLYSTLYRDNLVDIAHEDYYITNGFNYEDYGIHYETFVILHEIGHLQTVPTHKGFERYTRLEKKINKSKMEDYEKLIAYFNLEVEKNADKWAIEFIRKFPIIIQDLDQSIHSYKNNLLNHLKK